MQTGSDAKRGPGIWPGVLILAAGVGVGIVCRGPFFGVVLSAVVVVPVALIVELLWNRALRGGYLPSRRVSAVLIAVAVTVPAVAVYMLLRPPSGVQIVEAHLGLGRDEIRDVQTWTDTWGIDPVYCVKFRADSGALERAVAAGFVPESESATAPSNWCWHPARRMPTWWTPEKIDDSPWRFRRTGNPEVRLRFDRDGGEAYLLVMHL
jgi:hypothetical protein